MKKIFLALALVLSAISTWAYDVEVDGIYYNVYSKSKRATVTTNGGFNNGTFGEGCYSGDVVIPATITFENDVYDVTGIGERAFRQCPYLTSVEMPNSVTSIGFEAFASCRSLTSLTISDSVTYIGNSAFEGCPALTSVKIPNSLKSIGEETFGYCYALTSVAIGNSVTSIEEKAFNSCIALPSVTIPNSVTYLGYGAFQDCSNLKEIHSNATTPPTCSKDVFSQVKTTQCKLYVPTGAKEDYAFADGWCDFVNIIEEEVVNPSGSLERPTITYENKQLHFSCSDPNAKFVYSVKAEDNTTGLAEATDGNVDLTATYIITAYAKTDTATSEAAMATLVWATGALDADGISEVKSFAVEALPLLISQDNGLVTVSGLNDDDVVTAYSADGRKVATARSSGSSAFMNLSELRGKVAILTVNGKNARILVR